MILIFHRTSTLRFISFFLIFLSPFSRAIESQIAFVDSYLLGESVENFLEFEEGSKGEKKKRAFLFEDDLSREAVQRELEYYSDPRFHLFLSLNIQRSSLYFDHLIEAAKEANVPLELIYLPAIESVYDVNAVSYRGATGMWQFMQNSVDHDTMTLDGWRDDRKNFWIATDAAFEKLKYNYKKLDNDWLLALAAYNSGLTRVRRVIRETGITDFWGLAEGGHLPGQTIRYVPKFIAIASLLADKMPVDEYHIEWEQIPLDVSIDLAVLSQELSFPRSILSQGNAELNYRITPPTQGEKKERKKSDKSYQLKIPALLKEDVLSLLEDNEDPLLKFFPHKVRLGDTLSEIAGFYDIPMQMILSYNKGLRADSLKIGQVLILPTVKEGAEFRQKGEPNLAQSRKLPKTLPTWLGEYKIREGDTLWEIALDYNIDVLVLAKLNGLSLEESLSLGRVLSVP